MTSVLKFFATKFYRPLLQQYLSKERTYRYQNISLKILPGVFHPAFFFSTKFLLSYVTQNDLNKKSLLELGAGSGLISFIAEKKGAIVTATDVSRSSIENLLLNKTLLQSEITIVKSDLFDEIPEQNFDFVVINPPYYPKNPTSDSQLGWYCGDHFEYFEKLFRQLRERKNSIGRIVLVLSEDCDRMRIESIASANGFLLNEMQRRKFLWEWNYIFELKLVN